MTPNPDELQPAAGEPPVDFDQLQAASSDDPEILRELVQLYFDQAREIMAGLTAAVQQRSARDVDYLSHKLAGASLACGMTAVVAPLREMERRARQEDLTGAEEFVAQADCGLKRVRAATDDYLARQKS